MNMRKLLLADSVLLDIAAVVALVTGEAAVAVALFAVAAVVFIAFLALGSRQQQQVAA
jgi:hypothetical protein